MPLLIIGVIGLIMSAAQTVYSIHQANQAQNKQDELQKKQQDDAQRNSNVMAYQNRLQRERQVQVAGSAVLMTNYSTEQANNDTKKAVQQGQQYNQRNTYNVGRPVM